MTRHRALLLGLLLLFALGVRVYRPDWDEGHFFHPDERAIAYSIGQLSFHPLQLNPNFFAYGSFPFYVTKAVSSLLGNFNRWYAGYDGVIFTGRVISAFWGAGAVLLLVLLGARLYGWGIGLLSGLFLAMSVLHVQNSHFATNDIPLTFLVLLALYFMVRVVQTGRPRDYALGGLCIGLAAATKFSALPILLPLGIAVLARARTEHRLGRPLAWGVAAVVCVAIGFAIGQPYAILDYRQYTSDILEQSRMVRNAGLFPYTNQYIGVTKYVYDLRELVLWGMGPLLGIAAVWGTALRTGRALRRLDAAEIVLLAWVIPFFLVTGSFDVKFPRYLLPIYPFLALWAAAWLGGWARSSRLGRAVLGTVLVGTCAYLLAFMSIYTRPFSVVTGSQWVYSHIPSGSKILTQDWDEGFPFHLPGQPPERYRLVPLSYYEPDTPAKISNIANQLASGDYIIFQTKRLYGAITRAPQKFPLTNRYFYELFAGDLGYTLLKDIDSPPQLFGIRLPSELADESFSVYDHPKILIFQNTGHLSSEQIRDKVLRGQPSRPLTRNDLLLASTGTTEALGSGGGPDWIRSSVLATLLCMLLLEVLGLAMYALLRPALTPRLGLYALSKVMGVLFFAYLPWIAVGIGWLHFTSGVTAGFAALLVVLGIVAYRRHTDMALPRHEIVATEAIFWLVFFFFLLIRAYNPEIYWGEKPMDFSFLNAMYRTTALPPPEPWFAGSALHYTYFGYFVVAAIGKCLGIHPALMFNLGIATIGALTAAAAFAAGASLGRRWQVGIISATLLVLVGNLAGLREFLSRHQINFDYWWATSRVIKDTINEYPVWSFMFADLHAHLMVMPFSVGFICLLIMWVQRRERVSAHVPLLAAPVLLLLMMITLGAIMVTNGWSTPTYSLLLLFLLGLHWLTSHPWEGIAGFVLSGIGRVVLPAVMVIGGAVVLYLPFFEYFHNPPTNWGWERVQFAGAYDFLTINGLFVLLLVPFFFVVWRRTQLARDRRPRAAHWIAFAAIAIVLLLTLFVDVEGLVTGLVARLNGAFVAGPFQGVPGALFVLRRPPSIRIFSLTLALLGFFIAIHRYTPSRYRYPVALAAFAFAITSGVDMVHVWDRMNTVFKFYLEAWFLFSIASAVVLADLFSGRLARRVPRFVWQLGTVALLGLGLFTTVTGVIAVINTKRVPTPRPTLNGMAYLQQRSPEELAAFDWINRNVQGIPVLLEAQGPSYQEFSRVTMNTGLPIVLGWEYHLQQRAQSTADINRRKVDVQTIYTSPDKSKVEALLRRYHVALVFVGALERRTYAGANLENFRQWTDLVTPVYENRGVTIFAVNGQFAGAIPVNTIEEIKVEGLEEAEMQEPPGRLKQPRDIDADNQGFIYVADFGNNRIQKFDKDLKPVTAWGQRGELPGEFKDPCGVAVGPDQNIYVADTWNQRVQVFDPSGKYLREWSGSFYGPRGIAVGRDGTVYVADTGNHKIVRFTAEGQKKGELGGRGDQPNNLREPIGVAVDDRGRVYVADNGHGQLKIFDTSGRLLLAFDVPGWKSEVFSEPYLAIDKDGTIWATVPLEKEVRAYSPEGKLLRTLKSPPQPPNMFVTPIGITIAPASGEMLISDLENRMVVLKR